MYLCWNASTIMSQNWKNKHCLLSVNERESVFVQGLGLPEEQPASQMQLWTPQGPFHSAHQGQRARLPSVGLHFTVKPPKPALGGLCPGYDSGTGMNHPLVRIWVWMKMTPEYRYYLVNYTDLGNIKDVNSWGQHPDGDCGGLWGLHVIYSAETERKYFTQQLHQYNLE